jgi:hypothetical protein
MTPTMLCFSDDKNICFINLNNVESISFDETNPDKTRMTIRFTGSTMEEDLVPSAARQVKNILGSRFVVL